MSSSAYGTIEHKINNTLRKQRKLYYLWVRIFGAGKHYPDRNQFKRRYVIFFKYHILLPILPFYRLFKALRTGQERIIIEAKALRAAGTDSEPR